MKITFIPWRRAQSQTRAVGATAFWIELISIPARSNMPPLEPKSLCMSTTITAVRARSIVSGSGRAGTVTRVELPAIAKPR